MAKKHISITDWLHGTTTPRPKTKRKPQRDMSGVGKEYMERRDRSLMETGVITKEEFAERWGMGNA